MNIARFALKLDAQRRNTKNNFNDIRAKTLGKYWPMEEAKPAKPLTLKAFHQGWTRMIKSL